MSPQNEQLPPRCLYCRDFTHEEDEANKVKVPADAWVTGLRTSSCPYCRVLLQALQATQPAHFFSDLEADPNTEIQISPIAQGLVFVHAYRADGSLTLTTELQVSDSRLTVGNDESFRDVAQNAGDPEMWRFLRQCLTTCLETHELCRSRQASCWYPDRLLYCGHDGLRLINTRLEAPSGRYVALSYCWGESLPLRATTASLSHLQHGVSWDDLPRVFQDAITTSRQLGVQYLWVDSLCIVQDDRDDWTRHSRKMGDVYRNALLTISVVMSPDSRSPFLGPEASAAAGRRSAQTVYTSYVDDDYGLVSLRVRLTKRLRGKDCARSGPLTRRAWTFQERILSTRVVDFTDSVVTWNCASAAFAECGQVPRGWEGGRAPAKRRTDQNIDTRPDAWRRIIRDYSKRRITYASDRLPALSGIASHFLSALHTRYLAGLWESDMTRCLGWSLDLPPRKKADSLRRPLSNALPSWSWGSVDGGVFFCSYHRASEMLAHHDGDLPSEVEVVSQIEILQTSCIPSTDNELGELLPGSFIDVRGRVVHADWESDMYGAACVRRPELLANMVIPDGLVVPERIDQGQYWIRRQRANEDVDGGASAARIRGKVACLLLYAVETNTKPLACVLLLTPREGETYERVGLGAHKMLGVTKSEMDSLGIVALSPSGPDYALGEDEKWEDWEEIGTWENWEEWFADAEVQTVRIV